MTGATLQELADANRAYITVHGTPAPSLKDLECNGITAVMLVDGWKQRFVYTPAVAGTNFELFSVGPDGAARTADDLSIE